MRINSLRHPHTLFFFNFNCCQTKDNLNREWVLAVERSRQEGKVALIRVAWV